MAVVPDIGDFLIIVQENFYNIYDILSKEIKVCSQKHESVSKITCVQIHPDGIILATGHEDGKIVIWDI